MTSNPSPAYVGRVAAKFNNNGSGVKGDLGAVVRAIVTDPEALAGAADPNFGALRDPAMFTIAFLRGLGALAANGTGQSDGVLAPQVPEPRPERLQPRHGLQLLPGGQPAAGQRDARRARSSGSSPRSRRCGARTS